MTLPEDFSKGALDPSFEVEIIADPHALHGVWTEEEKPVDQLVEVLKRLGLSAVKRRIVARCHCKVEIFLTPNAKEQEEPETQDTEASTPPRSDGDRTAATTPDSHSPSSIKDGDVSADTIKWTQRQFFPMGRMRESEFLSDGLTVHLQDDPETDLWQTRVIWADGLLIQRRESTKLGITMYDTRCAIRRSEDEVAQLFQWTLIDHRDEDASTQVHYYLAKVKEDS